MDTHDDHDGVDHRLLQDEAVTWLVKRDSDEWTPQLQSQFETWLAQSTAHRVALLRLEAGWEGARRLKALSAGLPVATVPPAGAWDRSPFFESPPGTSLGVRRVTSPAGTPLVSRTAHTWRRRRSGFAIAATVVLALGIAAYLRSNTSVDRYSTPVGGVASVPLQDGSHITLNTRTQIRVDLTPKERRVELDQGEAFFVVAKDPKRPFVVRAGDKRIVAVGTQFSVQRDGDDVRIIVTEGTVRFETNGTPIHLRSPGSGLTVPATPAAIPLTAGAVARARDQDLLVQQEPLPSAEDALSWRQGYLIFHDTPLNEALAEFNRYNVQQLMAADPQTASIHISGMFRPTNYEAFVRLLQDGYDLRVHTGADRTVLSKE